MSSILCIDFIEVNGTLTLDIFLSVFDWINLTFKCGHIVEATDRSFTTISDTLRNLPDEFCMVILSGISDAKFQSKVEGLCDRTLTWGRNAAMIRTNQNIQSTHKPVSTSSRVPSERYMYAKNPSNNEIAWLFPDLEWVSFIRSRGLVDNADNFRRGLCHIVDYIRATLENNNMVSQFVANSEEQDGDGVTILEDVDELSGVCNIRQISSCGAFKMDPEILTGFHIINKNGDSRDNRRFDSSRSLEEVICRYIRTGIGRRLVHRWLISPCINKDEIRDRLNVVEFLVYDDCRRTQLMRTFLIRVPDLDSIRLKLSLINRYEYSADSKNVSNLFNAKQKALRRVSLKSIINVYECLMAMTKLVQHFDSDTLTEDPIPSFTSFLALINEIRDQVKSMQKFVELVNYFFDFEYLRTTGSYRICPNVDPDVNKNYDKVSATSAAVDGVIHAIHRQDFNGHPIGLLRLVNTSTAYSKAIRVPKKTYESCMKNKAFDSTVSVLSSGKRSKNKSYVAEGGNQGDIGSPHILISLNKNEYVFTTRNLVLAIESLDAAEKAYSIASMRAESIVKQVCSSYHSVLGKLTESLAKLDVLCAFANMAVTHNLTRTRDGDGDDMKRISLKGCRHLLLEESLLLHGKHVVPTDAEMNSVCGRVALITGPNMGGKSTYIRSVVMCAILNQIGSFVPCKEATLPLFHHVAGRIGASDSPSQSLSTFMCEMISLSSMLQTSTARSLVVVDELGRGTSTEDGFGIAWAVVMKLKSIGCFTLMATHFHELSAAEEVNSRAADDRFAIKNIHTEACVDNFTKEVRFLYSIKDGSCSQSFGLNVAKMAGYPQILLERIEEVYENMTSLNRNVFCSLLSEKCMVNGP